MVCWCVFSAREPAEQSSDLTLEEIQERAPTHAASAVFGSFVASFGEASQKFGYLYCHPLYALVFRPGCVPIEAQELTQRHFAELLLSG